ncbi:hypothetical protein ACW4TU_30125 [Streptomyces sp. QTS52]
MSLRAAALRTALERALGEPVHVLVVEHGVRLHVAAPDSPDSAAWGDVLMALRSADQWGSSDATGIPEIWVEVST